MTRLFVSLYFVIIVGIVLINWSSELIWQQLKSNEDPTIKQVKILTLTIAQQVTPQNAARYQDIAKAPVTLLEPSDISWLKWQSQLLAQGLVAISFDKDDLLSAYALTANKQHLLKLGPLALTSENESLKLTIISISYLILALVIALWLRPLWRDLTRLQQASSDFSQAKNPPIIPIPKGSAIAGVLGTFNTMTRKISRLIDEQKQLTNAVSHEIRTPLARLKFAFAMLNKDATAQLPAMERDVEELENLVDELLHYARLESHAEAVNMVEVNLHQLLTNQIEKLSHNSDKDTTLFIEPSLRWHCDGHLIERACQNYITNALRYAKSRVEVYVYIERGSLVIDVEDDGAGIAPNAVEDVFKPFTRIEKSRSKEHGGFGLGLAIVQRIAERHQGQCQVEKSALGGAKFSIRLPNVT